MNLWIRKSIEIANKPGYLDRLHDVYPVVVGSTRKISAEKRKRIREAVGEGDKIALIKTLLGLELFPIKDPYVAFFRRHPEALEKNPKTVERIGGQLLAMGYAEIIEEGSRPKEMNRRIGPLFKIWLADRGYPILEPEEFLAHAGTALLAGSDLKSKEFSDRELGARLRKRPDFVIRASSKFVIGEAKFLTDYGGHQDTQLNDALQLLHGNRGRAIRLAVLDGVVWIKGNNKMHRRIKKEPKNALSALLLEEFIQSLID